MLYFQVEFIEPASKTILPLRHEDGKILGALVANPNGAVGFLGLQDCPILKLAYESGSQIYLNLTYEVEGNSMFVIGAILSDSKTNSQSMLVKLQTFNASEWV